MKVLVIILHCFTTNSFVAHLNKLSSSCFYYTQLATLSCDSVRACSLTLFSVVSVPWPSRF
jgi:hypothetical protein